MTIKKRNFYLFILFCIFILLVYLKSFVFCDLFINKCLEEPYGGDLRRYFKHHYNDLIGDYYGLTLYIVFYLINSWLEFENFLILFKLIFYSILFLSGVKLFKEISLWKFNLFLFLIFFYPVYNDYSSVGLKQGLGMIFMLSTLFLFKNVFSFKSCLLILASIMSHYVFALFYLIFFICRFFSNRFVTLIFLLSTSFYILSYFIRTEDFFFEIIEKYLSSLIWVRFTNEINYFYLIVSFFPLFLTQIRQFEKFLKKNYLLNDLFKTHLLYSSVVYFVFTDYYYIERLLAVSWIIYPYYVLSLLKITKLKTSGFQKINKLLE